MCVAWRGVMWCAQEDEEEDGPGLLQWAYACVRSRAFFLGNDYFAFIPFLDMVRPHGSTLRAKGDSALLRRLPPSSYVATTTRTRAVRSSGSTDVGMRENVSAARPAEGPTPTRSSKRCVARPRRAYLCTL